MQDPLFVYLEFLGSAEKLDLVSAAAGQIFLYSFGVIFF